ncbi:MAG: DNA repair protein RadA [Xanthomonadales bacterium]|nr:DNA repair protein RadA [Xanthomonadales bacterium]
MAKPKPQFFCTECGSRLSKWAGQCPDCKAWNSVQEAPAHMASARSGGYSGTRGEAPSSLAAIKADDIRKHVTGVGELDRVLGGGLVSGSVVLLGGDPGIGKSTLLLQAAGSLAGQLKCLYVTGEESLQQVALRARRLGVADRDVSCLNETCVERILDTAEQSRPGLLIVDSIQTLFSEAGQSAPGSVSQVRDSAAHLVRYAKARDCAIVLVGHVTKEGALAGPRVLEHMVDVVLYFESDSGSRFRIVRSFKNRFGAVNEVGVFAMTDTGLKPVSNPSAIFLTGRSERAPGSVVTVARAGTRPLLLELQALVDESQLANPRRVAQGLDANRLSMLLAVLHRHGGIPLGGRDVFVNAVGGLRIQETASDLPTLLAVASSERDLALPEGLVAYGEVGLSGEIRPVHMGEERLKEASAHGLRHAIVPASNKPRHDTGALRVTPVDDLRSALGAAFN